MMMDVHMHMWGKMFLKRDKPECPYRSFNLEVLDMLANEDDDTIVTPTFQ